MLTGIKMGFLRRLACFFWLFGVVINLLVKLLFIYVSFYKLFYYVFLRVCFCFILFLTFIISYVYC